MNDDAHTTAMDHDDGPPMPDAPGPPETTVNTPREAMHHDEVSRVRRMTPTMMIMAAAALASLPLLGGHPVAKTLEYVGLLMAGAGACALRYLSADPGRYRGAGVFAAWYALVLATCINTIYLGVFSAAQMIVIMLVYLIELGESRSLGLATYVTASVTPAAAGGLVVTGATADVGLLGGASLTSLEQSAGLALIEIVLLGAFLFARAARRSNLDSLQKLHAAALRVSQREALVREVRQDLERARRIGAAGRLTGQVVGSFQLGELIGSGGMAEVYRGVHGDSGEIAAVKVLLPVFANQASALERFIREAKLAAALDVPNVVRVLEAGGAESQIADATDHTIDHTIDDAASDRGMTGPATPYLALEYLRGHDLAEELRNRRRLPTAEIVALVRDIGRGLDAAAAAGIVHRDIKPSNLFWAELGNDEPSRRARSSSRGPGLWKILDFGISRLMAQGQTLTQGNTIGTPAYMAPEQVRSQDVDPRADLYSLAATVYRALTGFPPFASDDLPALLYAAVNTMPRRPSNLVALPRPARDDVDSLLAVAMAKKPEDRLARASDLAEALDRALRGQLDPSLRRRGQQLIAAMPWSKSD